MIVAPNSPRPRANASVEPAPRPPSASGSAIRAKTRKGPAPSVRAAAGRVDSLESCDRAPQVERTRDEADREHDSNLRERDLQPEGTELAAEETAATEGGEEAEAGNRGRQHEWQLDQRDDQHSATEGAIREQVGRRRPHEQDEDVCDQARLQADQERVARALLSELRHEVAGRNTQEDRQHRQREERDRDDERDRERQLKEPIHGGGG